MFPIPTSVIPRLSSFWTWSLMLSVNEKKKKTMNSIWVGESRKNESSFEVRESQPRSLWRKYCTASSSVNRTNKDEISLPKSCNAVLIFYWSTALLFVRLYQVQLTQYMDIVIIMFITALVSTIKNVLINRESKEKTNNERSLHGHIFLYFKQTHLEIKMI